jgi:hypothetical protein
LRKTKLESASSAVVLNVGEVVARHSVLEELLSLELKIFQLDQVRLWSLSTEVGDDGERLCVAALIHEPAYRTARRVRKGAQDREYVSYEGTEA